MVVLPVHPRWGDEIHLVNRNKFGISRTAYGLNRFCVADESHAWPESPIEEPNSFDKKGILIVS